jgi:hypothetical protein
LHLLARPLVRPQHDHRAGPSSPAFGDEFSVQLKLLRGGYVSAALFGRLWYGSHDPHPTPLAATCSARDLEPKCTRACPRALMPSAE